MQRLSKAAWWFTAIALTYLTWRYFHDGLRLESGLGCLTLSAIAFAMTRPQLRHLFRNYTNMQTRVTFVLPTMFGVIFAAAGAYSANAAWVRVAGVGMLCYWGYLYYRYCINKRNFVKQGHGPLPANAWVNPPIEALQKGDVVLTSGCVAERTRQSVGHAEQVLEIDGALKVGSSWMGKGAVEHSADRVIKPGEHHWTASRHREPWTDEDNALAVQIFRRMLAQNNEYKMRTRVKRDRLLDSTPMPASVREALRKYFPIDGYDWAGLYTGRRAEDRWTCIGLVLELHWRMGKRMRWLGTGLFGLGTGLFDPLAADRLLAEPSLRLLTLDDKAAFERAQAAKAAAAAATVVAVAAEDKGA